MAKQKTKQELVKLAKAIYTLNLRKEICPIDFFEPQLYQQGLFRSTKKDLTALGGNRSGKTICGAAYCIDYARNNPNAKILCATWADLQVAVQMTKVNELLPKNAEMEYAVFNDKRGFTNKIIMFTNGSIMRFKTFDQGRESFQGGDYDVIWPDEEPPEDVLSEMKARLMDRNGILLRTMTPLKGFTYTYDQVVLNEKNNPEIDFWYFPTSENKHIDQNAVNRILDDFPEKEAKVRRSGHFMELKHGITYYSFGNDNIIPEDKFKVLKYRPLEISCDFNVDLMCWNIGQEQNGVDYTFDFVELEGQANTELLCQMLRNKFPQHDAGWIFYGDMSGNNRTPNATRTSWAIIREYFPNSDIFYNNIKAIKDRVDSSNARYLDSRKRIKAYVTENCKRLIKDRRKVTWEHLLNKQKAGALTHTSDGEDYKFYHKYPLDGMTLVTQG